ncbi:MAG TPA: putative baseplate assembly protein [Thermoanaerobaculia bacterium]|nr:putative baseplate assembly protein [Thermoanaerobaculia bacterium]
MPIEPPQLDDLRFDRTVEELVRRIPTYAPEWTDHNASDPGISLLQLFAYVTEQIGYRLNRLPEKNHVELLKLLGVRLQPAHAARTTLALLLTNPSTLIGYPLAAGAKARAKKGTPPPVYETDWAVDVVPAEMVLLVTTKNPHLDDLLLTDSGRETPAVFPDTIPNGDTEWLRVAWDGKAPKLKDMPEDPVALAKTSPSATEQPYLWIGLDFNPVLSAGFRDVRVTLTLQFDDDEKPDLTKDVRCATPQPVGEEPKGVDWLAYFDAAENATRIVPGRIDDTTDHLSRSGTIRFTVPHDLGPITAWAPLRPASTVGPLEACLTFGDTMASELESPSITTLDVATYRSIVDDSILKAHQVADAVHPAIEHPFDPALRAKAAGWLRLTLPPRKAGEPPKKLRIATFNAVEVTNATTVTNEILGRGDGRPGQRYFLANRNVLDGTLDLAIQEAVEPTTPLVNWREVRDLDEVGPFESAYELDREAGAVQFGDGGSIATEGIGRGGRIPPLVPKTGDIVARRYRFGGGLAGEVPVGAITSLDTAANGVSGVVNFVAATGGRDAETLEQAKRRARKELSTRTRAVTTSDFEWITLQTPDVRVARAHIVPLRRPVGESATAPAVPSPARCGPALPAGATGLDRLPAPGAVTVVVVPDEEGPEPTPVPSFLRAVCRQLDSHRLVTTEIHVVPPQYCRVCKVYVRVRSKPGYARSALQGLVEKELGTYLHVLTGGEDGKGFPFGEQLHIADLVARVFRTEGVERVELLSAEFTRTKSGGVPREGKLVLCPGAPGEVDRVALAPEENVSFDAATLTVATIA